MIARRESGRSALVERPGEWLNNNGIVADVLPLNALEFG